MKRDSSLRAGMHRRELSERHMKQPKSSEPLNPDHIYRLREGRRLFGYGPTQLAEKIKSGEIPPPMDLSETGRAKGWLGRVIIEHHERRLAASKQR
jgi:predicted DNA-binding transcriptional regulator AlpA